MTTLTLYRGRGGRWMVHSDRKSIPECLRDMPAGPKHYDREPGDLIRLVVEECNPGTSVVLAVKQML